jgi:hypothetical protein
MANARLQVFVCCVFNMEFSGQKVAYKMKPYTLNLINWSNYLFRIEKHPTDLYFYILFLAGHGNF